MTAWKTAWDKGRVSLFWAFVAERHNMFVRRFGERQPPPWTDDPVLARGHFTNVYRELDRGTRYLIVNILPGAQRYPVDTFFSVVLYRAFNLISTYEALVKQFSREAHIFTVAQWTPVSVARFLVDRQRAGHKIYTGAYLVNSVGARPGLGGKAELSVRRLTALRRNVERIYREVVGATTMADTHRALCQIPGVAEFNAYEIVIDLCYGHAFLSFSENDWVNVGPGALKGLQLLRYDPVAPRTAVGLVEELRTAQRTPSNGPPLTLRNVEHSLCEFSKYWRAREREKHRFKRTYQPGAHSTDYTLWAGVPVRYFQGGHI